MDFNTFFDVFSLLGRWEKTFPYHKDRYALMLLEYAAQDGISVAELKRGPFARLLSKPLVCDFLGRHGSAHVHADDVRAFEVPATTRFRVSFTRWPDEMPEEKEAWQWEQISRPGFNLVLQLNFPLKHNHRARRLLRHRLGDAYMSGHPARFDREISMAWARIDLDLDHGQALIEELQTDWIREVLFWAECSDYEHVRHAWKRYFQEQLEQHARTWAEAMLSAAITYLARHLGIRDIWYHTFDGGRLMKRMGFPPRSLYTSLPKRFCFQETRHAPHFLRRERNAEVQKALGTKSLRWHVLRL